MQGLISIGLRVIEPVADTVRMTLVNLRQRHVDVEALVDLLLAHLWNKDDAHGQNVVDLIEGDVLVLHLVPDGIRCLHPLAYLIVDAHFLQGSLNGFLKLVERLMTGYTCLFQFPLNKGIFLWMFKLETEVLELRLNLIKSQSVGYGGIEVECLTSNLILLVGRLRVEGAHIVQTVGNLDENHADVLAHGEKQLLEVLGLGRSLLAENAAADLGESVDNLGNLRSEHIADILNGIVGIFHHIMKQGRADTGRAQSYL